MPPRARACGHTSAAPPRGYRRWPARLEYAPLIPTAPVHAARRRATRGSSRAPRPRRRGSPCTLRGGARRPCALRHRARRRDTAKGRCAPLRNPLLWSWLVLEPKPSELGARAREARHGRSLGYGGDFGDCAVRETLQLAQDQDFAERRRQDFQQAREPAALARRGGGVLRIRARKSAAERRPLARCLQRIGLDGEDVLRAIAFEPAIGGVAH